MLALAAIVALAPVIRLWPGAAPGALGNSDTDVPTLTLFMPEHPCGSAIVVCPGGGYAGLADHEGSSYALFLNRLGITAFVLKYRLGSSGYRYPVEYEDVERAVRTVRARAGEWRLDPHRIGIMGSSAGGHLASMALTRFDAGRSSSDPIERAGSRPDFGILCYPVISMGSITHAGSKHELLGDNPSAELVKLTSSELQVTPRTPPCFIWQTEDDNVVPVANSIAFADALKKAHVPYELHLYAHGPHGLGLGGPSDADFSKLLPWTRELTRWLVQHNWSWAPKSKGG